MSEPAISPSFDAHLRALGRLCITWAVLNRHLTDLISVYIGQGPEITAALYSGNETLFARCEALKKLILVRPLTEKWDAQLTALAGTIMQPLGRDRNRYVHDEWHDGDLGIVRIDFRTTREQPQSRQKMRLRSVQWYHDEAEKVRRLSDEIEIVTYQLHIATIILSMHWHEKRPLRPFWRQRGLTELRKKITARDADGA